MTTIQEAWIEYRDLMYPDGISGVQDMETHQAFICGAAICLEMIEKISDLPEAEAMNTVHLFKQGLAEILIAHKQLMEDRKR